MTSCAAGGGLRYAVLLATFSLFAILGPIATPSQHSITHADHVCLCLHAAQSSQHCMYFMHLLSIDIEMSLANRVKAYLYVYDVLV